MFNFNLTVSDQGFETKPKDYTKITFTEQNVTMTQMVDYIKNGHLFSCVYDDSQFGIKYKVSEHFVSTNVIPIDIDDCDCSMMDYIPSLKYKPTIAYETFSNLKDGKGYRFRLLYVFRESMDADNYTLLYNAICRANEINDFNDTHAKSPYQKYFGTSRNGVIVSLGSLYSFSSLSSFIDENDLNRGVSRNSIKEEQSGNVIVTGYPFNDKEFEKQWNNGKDEDIMTQFRQYYTHSETKIDFDDGELYRFIDDIDFFSVWRKWKMMEKIVNGSKKKIPSNVKIKNGEHRRRFIFVSLVKRRLIDPSITIEHLCYAALYELCFYIDNTDKKDTITRYELKQIANSAMGADLSEYRENMKTNRSFKVNKQETTKRGMTVQQAVGMANGERNHKRKMERYETYIKYYDPSKTDKENIQILKDNGIDAPTLNRYRMFRRECITTKKENNTINTKTYEENNKEEGKQEGIVTNELPRIFANRTLERCIRKSKGKGTFQMPIMWQ